MTFQDHENTVREILTRCRTSGITLNAKKFQFGQEEVEFAGFRLSTAGVGADPEKLAAVARFPRPTNITQMRSFMGLVEQLADFTSDISKMAGPLRPLLKAKNAFMWDSEHDKAFEDTKKALVSLPVLANFQHGRPLFLHTDASRSKGLGFALLQEDQDGNKRLLQAGSRFITETEARYAMVELELLGVTWAMKIEPLAFWQTRVKRSAGS